jgi:dTDP-4-dehydrorhamnose reductase
VALGGDLLVTGAGGQLGRALGGLEPGAVLLDRSRLDVCDPAAVAETIGRSRPAVVIHAAAWTKVDDAESDPDGAHRTNVDGTRSVAEAAARAGALLVYVSTDYVFPGDRAGRVGRPDHPVRPAGYRETDATGPRSVYGRTKLAGEAEAAAAGPHLVVRTSWVFGEGHNFVRSILRAAATRDEVAVVDDQRGLPTYAADLAGGILRLVEGGAEGLFHLAGGGEAGSWADLAEAALTAAGSPARVRRISTAEYLEGRTGPVAPRPACSVLDCRKAAARGVVLRSWRAAVAEYVSAEHPSLPR